MFYDFLTGFFTDYTTQTIALGTIVLGGISGVLGSYAILRKQSLLGDAVAHAALPGIALAFLLSGIKNPLMLFLGAALSGWLASIWITNISNTTRIKSDTSLALVLAVFFGFGMVLLTYIQKVPTANQAGLETFLFGQAATLIRRDVLIMSMVAGIALLIILFLWKELKLLTFDPQFARSAGFNVRMLEVILNSLIVVAIVLGLQAVGVVLMSALLIAPAAAARQWTNRMSTMVILSMLFGALSGLIGTMISSAGSNISTGPVIILFAFAVVVISFIFAPERGLLAVYLIKQKSKRKFAVDRLLAELYDICRKHADPKHPHSVTILKTMPDYSHKSLEKLKEKKLIEVDQNKNWCLTPKGIERAQNVFNHQDD